MSDLNNHVNNLSDLRTAISGTVLLPGDEDFASASKPWNLAVSQSVSAVVEAADAADVAALVRYARDRGLTIATQPSGHGASGDVEGVILLRTGRLDEIRVDPSTRIARVGAGVKGGQVQAVAASHGLTGLPGSSPVTSVAGYTLGGGMSWFGRKFGWASDGVVAFDVVAADGEFLHVSEDENTDLFWALRGGGGDFAIMTALEYRLHEAPALYGGRIVWPAAKAPQVFEAFRRLTATAPDELTVWLDLVQPPGGAPAMVTIDVTYLGDEATAKELLTPLDAVSDASSDNRGALALTDLAAITAEPTDPSPAVTRADLLTGFGPEVGEVLLAEPIAPLISIQVRHFGGAFAAPSDGPSGPLTEPYGITTFGIPFTPEIGAAVRAKQDALHAALAPWTSGRKPFNGLASGDSAADVFGPASLARLRAVKAARDPKGVFRANFPVSE